MQCPICGGEGVLLGRLGLLLWYRCRDCGIPYYKQAETDSFGEPVDDDEEED